jgi:GR25 family glycosyltransferase involved in LPS biosynthesis
VSIPYAVIFRVHFWDEFVAAQFRRLQARAGTDDLFVVVDETRGPVAGISHDKVLRITEDISESEGFYQFPKGNSFWHNTDYTVYHFIGKYPGFKYIVACEYDVAVNVDIFPIVQAMQAEGLDFVGEHIRTPIEHWTWKDRAQPYYGDALQFTGRLCCIAIFSWEFAIILQLERKDHWRRLRNGDVVFPDGKMTWPSNEAFIGAEIERLSISEKPFAAFANMSNYDWWPPYHPDHVDQTKGDTIFHPVLKGERLVKSLLKYDKILPFESWLEPKSKLRNMLNCEPPSIVVPALLAAMVKEKKVNAIAALWLELHNLGWQEHVFPLGETVSQIVLFGEPTNLALGKSCTQSSVSQWSRSQIPSEDAGNAVNGRITGDYAFHTNEEFRPWWMVDLGGFALVSEIILFNRLHPYAARANNLSLWGSLNGRSWMLLHERAASTPFGGAEGSPLRIEFPEKRPLRFLRVELLGSGILHLDEVQVFGAVPQSSEAQTPKTRQGVNFSEVSTIGDLKEPKISAFIINLEHDAVRRKLIMDQMMKLDGFEAILVSGINGGNLPDTARHLLADSQSWQLQKGALGCFLSHVKVWELAAKSVERFLVVLEDDANVEDLKKLRNLQLPDDFEIIFINERMSPKSCDFPLDVISMGEALRHVNIDRAGFGTDGYLITPSGAAKLLEACKDDLYFGHVDGRLVRYATTAADLEFLGMDSAVVEVIQKHHNSTRLPQLGILKGYVSSSPLVKHAGLPSSRRQMDQH